MSRRAVPPWCRYVTVSRDPDGTARVWTRHLFRGGAVAEVRRRKASRSTWQQVRRLVVEPTDWAPRERRVMRVVDELGRGPASAAQISRRTALSPGVVELALLDLRATGWAFCPVGELRGGPWRLRRAEEWQAWVLEQGRRAAGTDNHP